MPHYHFHAYKGDEVHGRESYDFPDFPSTRHGAAAHVGRLLPALGAELFERDMRLEVTNEDGLILLSVIVVASDMTRTRSR